MDNDRLTSLDVFKYYDQSIKDLVQKNTDEYINAIFEKSNYNKKLAKQLLQKIEIENKQIAKYNSKFYNKPNFLHKIKKLNWFFFLLILIGGGIVGYGYSSDSLTWIFYIGIPILSLGGLLLIIFICLYFKWKRLSKKSKNDIEPIIVQNKNNIAQMQNEMLKITSLIKARDCFDIYEKSFTNFKIYNHISVDDYDLWHDVLVQDNNESLYCEMHGDVYNHPFMYLTLKFFEMKDVPYTGSVTITVTRRDSKRDLTVVPRTVSATIYKPKPFFIKKSHFVYKVGVYPELKFNNLRPFSHKFQLNSFYKKHKNYSKMENLKFDMFLPCERNDDLQFHTIFSIYTQEQIVNCIEQYKLKNLKLVKEGMYVYTSLDNELTNKRLVYSGDVFVNYSPDAIKDNFANSMNNNMKFLYQYMSPIFSIGFLQQERFNYRNGKSKDNDSFGCMVQKIINSNANISKYLNKQTSTNVFDGIPKSKILYETPNYVVSNLDLNSFNQIQKVEHVTKFVEGKFVSIPIYYYEYNKINQIYLALSWINNSNMKDFCIESKNEFMNANKIKGIYKYVDQVLVVFDSSLTSIKGNEKVIINGVNNMLI